jgi:nucleoside phosphorylase
MYIVCPLEFERSALRRLAAARGWNLACCGPGAAAVAAWARQGGPPAGSTVVLAGVAGSLRPSVPSGEAVEISSIVDEDATMEYVPRRLTKLPRVRCISVHAPLATVEAKREEAARNRADIVDMESAAFAREAIARQWRWSVVRGISDGATESLPLGVDGWTDERGKTRLLRVAGSLARQPWMVREVTLLGARSFLAMDAVQRALAGEHAGG